MSFIEFVHRAIDLLPVLARFAIMMALILAIPRIARALRIPVVVGLLLSGVLLGPHMLDVFPRDHPSPNSSPTSGCCC
jgi:Kef-type K+ transport system membrane component KefB